MSRYPGQPAVHFIEKVQPCCAGGRRHHGGALRSQPFVMLRLAGSSRYGVRCLTFAFTAAAALCVLAATIIFPAIHMEALSINPLRSSS